jgi:hypothetical protein
MAQVKNNMVHGVAPVLQALRQLEPEMYKQIVVQLKDETNDLRMAVANQFPDKPWQSSTGVINWTRYGRKKRGRKSKGEGGANFPRWEAGKVKRGVTVQVGGRKVRRTNAYPILRVKQSDAAGSVFDLAKNGNSDAGMQFVNNLKSAGTPSRVMWKSVEKFYPLVEGKVRRTLDSITNRFTAEIAAETAKRNAQSIRASQQIRTAAGRFGKAF